jgi:hypothetical protein
MYPLEDKNLKLLFIYLSFSMTTHCALIQLQPETALSRDIPRGRRLLQTISSLPNCVVMNGHCGCSLLSECGTPTSNGQYTNTGVTPNQQQYASRAIDGSLGTGYMSPWYQGDFWWQIDCPNRPLLMGGVIYSWS